ncbi:flavin-containing monooxygenase [Nocardia blacklockiae]|uniref:flavin-containing monooxygenase n=1 Tax=Nocardia blacklockiae TaxID=480036 RepID=UPI001892F00B|nr:NAD(P)/FAD-dependent oxidoreductase [Nocardia blacklockiae]MBF6172061.1 NAD(P)/FAD-dependent oxidoreductase [Nocardia blacklockiae]
MHYSVVIIGSGFGGIGMGAALERAGIHDFVILEEGPGLGGVWRDNTYPGCSCDVPAHLYSFSFAPYRSTRTRFPDQRRTLDYLRRVVEDRGLAPHLRPNSAVTEATYLEHAACWALVTANGSRLTADFVVFAVGQLHRPYVPVFPGHAEFAGAAFHTAQWDHGIDLDGRDIAVVGTGSSAAQVLPTLQARARKVTVFQRTPHWILPKPADNFGPLARTALRLPGGHRAYRWVVRQAADSLLSPIMRRGWPARPARWLARAYLRREVADPLLRERLTPRYPIGAKRILFDRAYYRTLRSPNVELVTAPIAGMCEEGIETVDGTRHRADVVVYATGFRASEFLTPIVVRGRGGRMLHDQWRSGAAAFMGLAVPGFPNAFLIAGPNSFNPAGSNPAMKEHQIDYIMRCLRWRAEIGSPAIEVGTEAMATYQRWLRAAIARTVWASTGSSWYKHESGAVTNPWPASARTYARMLRTPPEHSFQPVARRATEAA